MAFVMTIPKFAHGNGTVNSLIFRISCLMRDPPRFGGASWLVCPPLWRNVVRILEGKPKVFKTNAINKKMAGTGTWKGTPRANFAAFRFVFTSVKTSVGVLMAPDFHTKRHVTSELLRLSVIFCKLRDCKLPNRKPPKAPKLMEFVCWYVGRRGPTNPTI